MQTQKSKVFLWILAVLAGLGGLLTLIYQQDFVRPAPKVAFSGETMGTTYEVQIAGLAVDEAQLQEIRAAVEAELLAVNQAMSTYLPDSEISQFNRGQAGRIFPVSPRFRDVLLRSFDIYRLTDGCFDPTLGPLIDLWGFGAKKGQEAPVVRAEVDRMKARTGMQYLKLSEAGLTKEISGIEINLSAIAKGYAVDRVADLLTEAGYKHIYVEIGGELYCRGLNQNRVPWRIGIQVPAMAAEERAVKVLSLADHGLATSGDYRNFAADENGLRHHILDPRTGSPARHTLASVSVLSADCMTADAVATALYVMGTEQGMDWLKAQPGLEALFIDREGDGYRMTATPGFEAVLIALP